MRLSRTPRRVGIFGGAFDPVHTGHLRAAIEARETLGLDLLLFVPAGRPPHKNLPEKAASGLHRLAMLRSAVDAWPWMKLSDLELRKKGISYTAETLAEIRDLYGEECEYFLLIGSDWKGKIKYWKDYPFIRKNCRIVCFERSRVRSGSRRAVQLPVLDIGSTLIRQRLASGRDVSLLVPDSVLRYIRRNRLYGYRRV